ncbi:MAG: serine/threonine protein kinase [Solirubrobacterales bacterium]|nr:serine/threonine protein kinase [Solirubrobacterales bacterium]
MSEGAGMLKGHRSALVVLVALVVGWLPAGAASAAGTPSTAKVSAKQQAAAKQRAAARKKALAKKRAAARKKALAKKQAAAEAKRKAASPLRDALFVGNNWDGTIDVVDPDGLRRITRINAIPDIEQRKAEIAANPVRLGYFLLIGQLIGEGHDQFVDDVFSSHDGRFIYISRPSLADVVAIELATRKIVWRVPVEGNRADHMAISPDGTRLLVSASTARKVHVIDTAAGKIVANIDSGDQPHESNYSADGKLIFHASIGTVYTPADDYALDAAKGDRFFEVIDATTYKVIKRLDIGKILRTFGFPGMSSAVRPMAISPDERYAYFQLSFLHGFVEFDLKENRPLRIATLPLSESAAGKSREEYLLDSAHHGLAMNRAGTKLCVAGTMSDYAAIVDRQTFAYTIGSHGLKPYWATTSADGNSCVVSYSGDDRVALISYETGKETASIPVGDHPQRVRVGVVRKDMPAG